MLQRLLSPLARNFMILTTLTILTVGLGTPPALAHDEKGRGRSHDQAFRIHGVTQEFIDRMATLGYDNLIPVTWWPSGSMAWTSSSSARWPIWT